MLLRDTFTMRFVVLVSALWFLRLRSLPVACDPSLYPLQVFMPNIWLFIEKRMHLHA